jgi:hypothetical protein
MNHQKNTIFYLFILLLLTITPHIVAGKPKKTLSKKISYTEYAKHQMNIPIIDFIKLFEADLRHAIRKGLLVQDADQEYRIIFDQYQLYARKINEFYSVKIMSTSAHADYMKEFLKKISDLAGKKLFKRYFSEISLGTYHIKTQPTYTQSREIQINLLNNVAVRIKGKNAPEKSLYEILADAHQRQEMKEVADAMLALKNSAKNSI